MFYFYVVCIVLIVSKRQYYFHNFYLKKKKELQPHLQRESLNSLSTCSVSSYSITSILYYNYLCTALCYMLEQQKLQPVYHSSSTFQGQNSVEKNPWEIKQQSRWQQSNCTGTRRQPKLRVNSNLALISPRLLATGIHDQVKTTLITKRPARNCRNSNNLHVYMLEALQNCQAKCDSQISVEFSKFLSEDMLFS